MFNNAEEHLQGKFRRRLNFAPFFLLSLLWAQLQSLSRCRFFYIAIGAFCKILIGDTAVDLLAVSGRGG